MDTKQRFGTPRPNPTDTNTDTDVEPGPETMEALEDTKRKIPVIPIVIVLVIGVLVGLGYYYRAPIGETAIAMKNDIVSFFHRAPAEATDEAEEPTPDEIAAPAPLVPTATASAVVMMPTQLTLRVAPGGSTFWPVGTPKATNIACSQEGETLSCVLEGVMYTAQVTVDTFDRGGSLTLTR